MATYRSRPYRRRIPSGIDALTDASSKMPQVAVKGDLLWFDGADMQRIPAGAAGEILRMVNGIPTWQTLAEAGIAPNTPDFLVGTSDAALTGEIVVGTTPGGELGNTWASPTVDTTHSGSAHHAAVTLAADADTLLSLSTQELGLDTQVANRVLAGPRSEERRV